MRHIALSGFALVLLAVLPVVLETPATPEGEIAAALGALILVAVAVGGVVRYVRSRKPKSYHDSVMPPVEKTPRK